MTVPTSRPSSVSSLPSLLPLVHSTFRDYEGDILYPEGLEWRMPGKSHVRFVVPDKQKANFDSEAFRHDLVQAYNRWCFAKDLNFRTVGDIASMESQGDLHVKVEWKESGDVERIIKFENIATLLRDDPAASNDSSSGGDNEAAEVWVNGVLVGTLDGAETIEPLLASIPETANKLCFKRSKGRIRIDRFFVGGLRRNQAWDHIWDCLVALEDSKIIDDNTIIGTATLRDWIMGGNLTSRLWVHDTGDSIKFLRPLYNDDIQTSDRKYEIKEEKEPEKVKQARGEIARLRYLATVPHPYVSEPKSMVDDPLADARAMLRRNQKRGKYFGF